MIESSRETTVYIETAGCAFNVSDGEAMAGVLKRDGFGIAESAGAADIVILNTCTVKDRSYLDFRKRFRQLREVESKPVVVAGCIAKAYAKADFLGGVSTLGPDAVASVTEVVRQTLRGRAVSRVGGQSGRGGRGGPGTEKELSSLSRSSLPIVRRNPIIEILPIARGCRSACTFCQTRLARGRLASFAPGEIVRQAERALAEGVRELWVTGQDTGAYGHDIGSSLPELLRALLELPGEFRLRLGMSSPQWIDERLAEMLDVFAHPKIFRFLHVPVQSGSERVLREMRRDGTAAQFERIHEAFIERFPEGTVLTDIIAGYPTETEADFEETLELLCRVRLPGVNCSRFSPRPGTPAARLRPLPSSVISERSKRLMNLVKEISGEYHAARVGKCVSVLIDQAGPRGSVIGRTASYRPVMIREDLKFGSSAEVEILKGEPFRFVGRSMDPRSIWSS